LIFHSTLTSETLYWFDYMANELDEAARGRLVPVFPYLDAELVIACSRWQPRHSSATHASRNGWAWFRQP
jgi:hypothetical protein